MLKQALVDRQTSNNHAAASARLCVETHFCQRAFLPANAAASARLCVETNIEKVEKYEGYAAASARLCVETTILP